MRLEEYGVIVVGSLPPPITGQSTASEILIDYLQNSRIEYKIICFSRWHSGVFCSVLKTIDKMLLPLRAGWSAANMRRPRVMYIQGGQRTVSIIRDLSVAVVSQLLRIPFIIHIHGGSWRRGYESAPRLVQAAASRWMYSQAEYVIVLTPTLRRMLDGITTEDRVAVVSNGADRETVESALAAQTEPKSPSGGLRLLFLSSLIQTKGYDTVLEAARLAISGSLAHEFVIAGEARGRPHPDPQDYKRQFRLDNVRILGPIVGGRKAAVLNDCDALVLPTRYEHEGQPLAILEAMHFGLPIITTNIGGIADVVKDGQNGFIIPADDAEALLEAADRLLDEQLRKDIGQRNQECAQAAYTPDRHGRKLCQLLKSAAR